MVKLLTKKKQSWVDQFKPTAVMRGAPLQYNVSVQSRYVKDMVKLFADIVKKTEVAVKQIYRSDASKEHFAMDASISSQSRIRMNKLNAVIAKMIGDRAGIIVSRMLKATDKTSKSALNYSLKELSGGLNVKTDFKTAGVEEAIKSSWDENVRLIKTMGDNYVSSIRGAVNRSIQGGGGLEELIPNIQKMLSKESAGMLNKAKNVALDQTRKAYTSITVARMEKVGVDEFEWLHTGGSQNPREYHQNVLNGNIYSISNPPIINPKTGERGLPGQEIFCHCVIRPIVRFDKGDQV